MRTTPHRVVLALLAVTAACSTTSVESIDPRLVGRYEWWGIDSGAFLELRADGTWVKGDVGMGALFFRTCGRWSVSGDTIELRATHTGYRDEPSLHSPLPESIAQSYPRHLAIVGSGVDCELQPKTGPRVPWQRVAAQPSDPHEASFR